jgi:hypothetical protein
MSEEQKTNTSSTQSACNGLLCDLVDAAARIAMFDMPWDDESVSEVKSVRSEFRDAFRNILKKHKRSA